MVTSTVLKSLKTPPMLYTLRALLLLLIGVELYLSLIPIDLEDVDIPGVDKLMHFAMHACNICLASLAFPKARPYLIAAALLLMLGPLIEWLQSMTPDRTASLADQLANTLGFLVGWFFAKQFLRD